MDDPGLHLVCNGVLVTTDSPGPTMPCGLRYRGPAYGDAWPLNPHSIERLGIGLAASETELIGKVWEATAPHQNPADCAASETPDVLADVSLALSYVRCCQAHGISVRALLCATPSPYPRLSGNIPDLPLPPVQHLGYDYWDGGEFSALWDTAMPELSGFERELNSFGLFQDADSVMAYALARNPFETAGEVEFSTWMVTSVSEIRL